MTVYSSLGTMRLTDDEKNKIVRDFLPQVKSWAIRAKSNLPDAVDIDDLYSAAALGLIECLDKYDKSRNATFATYVEHRVKGAMLDALRGLDFLSRSARSKVKALDGATSELSKQLGRTPTVNEIADYTEMEEDEVHAVSSLKNSERLISLDDNVGLEDGTTLVEFIQSERLTPEEEVLQKNLTEVMAEEIDRLPEKERLVISLYYYEELTMKEIASVLDLTESRVSQIHSSAMKKMKKRLKDIEI